MLTAGPSFSSPFPWLLQWRAGPLPLFSCLTLEQCLTCSTVPSAGQPGHGLHEGSQASGWSGSLDLLASAGNSLCSQGWGSLGCRWGCSSLLVLTAWPQGLLLAGSGSGSSTQGLGSILRPTQQPQLNSWFFVEPLHAARGNCERSLTLVGYRHFSPPTSARGSPRPQKAQASPQLQTGAGRLVMSH